MDAPWFERRHLVEEVVGPLLLASAVGWIFDSDIGGCAFGWSSWDLGVAPFELVCFTRTILLS